MSEASHQVLAQSNLWFGRCRLKNFKMAAVVAILNTGTECLCNSESPCSHNASHKMSAQSDVQVRRRCQKCEKLTADNRGRTTGRDIS